MIMRIKRDWITLKDVLNYGTEEEHSEKPWEKDFSEAKVKLSEKFAKGE
jgi:hypothetical protein